MEIYYLCQILKFPPTLEEISWSLFQFSLFGAGTHLSFQIDISQVKEIPYKVNL